MSDQNNTTPTDGTAFGYIPSFWDVFGATVPTEARLPVQGAPPSEPKNENYGYWQSSPTIRYWSDTSTPPTETVVQAERSAPREKTDTLQDRIVGPCERMVLVEAVREAFHELRTDASIQARQVPHGDRMPDVPVDYTPLPVQRAEVAVCWDALRALLEDQGWDFLEVETPEVDTREFAWSSDLGSVSINFQIEKFGGRVTRERGLAWAVVDLWYALMEHFSATPSGTVILRVAPHVVESGEPGGSSWLRARFGYVPARLKQPTTPEPTNVVIDQGVDVVVTEPATAAVEVREWIDYLDREIVKRILGDVELVPSEPAAATSRIGGPLVFDTTGQGQNRFGVTGGNTLTPSRDRVLDRPAGTDPVFRPSAHAQRSIAEGERLKAARRAAVERQGRLIKAGIVALACLAVAAHGPLLLAARALRAWLGGVLVLALVLGSGCTSAQAQADLAAVEADVHAGLAYADEGLTWASDNSPQLVAAIQTAAAKDPTNKLLQSVATKAVTAINAGDLTTAKALVHAGSVATTPVAAAPVSAPVTSGQ
jgi:hypothetical protein